MEDSDFNFRITQHGLETVFSMSPGDLHVYSTPGTDLSEKLSSQHSSVN